MHKPHTGKESLLSHIPMGPTLLGAKTIMMLPRVTSHIPPLPADPYCFLLLKNLVEVQQATHGHSCGPSPNPWCKVSLWVRTFREEGTV